MDTKIITDLYASIGVLGLVVVAFFVLVFWVVKTSKQREDSQNKASADREDKIMKAAIEREDKLYSIIDALSEQLPWIRDSVAAIPQLKETLARMEQKIDKG